MRIETEINGWVIRSDNMNIILCKSAGTTTDPESGKETERFTNETFHRDIQGVLESLCRKEICTSKATTIEELKNCFAELVGAVNNMAEAIGEGPLKRAITEMRKE